MNRIKSLLAPPIFQGDEGKTRLAKILHTLAMYMLGSVIIYTVLWPLIAPDFIERIVYIIPFYPVIIGILVLVRRGRLQTASALLVAGMGISLAAVAYSSGGVSAPAYSGLAVIVLCAGILLGRRAAVVTAILAIAAGGIMVFYGGQEVAQGADVFNNPTTNWLAQSIFFMIAAALLQLATSNVQDSLSSVERELEKRKLAEAELKNYAEMFQQRANQLATLNKVGSSISALSDLPTVFESIYEMAHTSLQADFFFIGLYDKQAQLIFFPLMYDEGKRWEQGPAQLNNETYSGRVIRSREPILVNQVTIEPDETDTTILVGNPERITSSLMFAPLISRDEVIGIISVQSYKNNSFNDPDLELLIGMANQAATAIENARLYSMLQQELTERERAQLELKKRVEELIAVNEVTQTLVNTLNSKHLINSVGEQVRAIFNIPVLFIGIHDTQTNLIHFDYFYDHGQKPNYPPIVYGTGMSTRVMEMQKPLLINNNWLEIASSYDVIIDEGDSPARATLTVPLLVGERAIGVISLQDNERENVFSEEDVRLLVTIASSVAVAVDNARLNQALQNELNERQKLIEQLEAKNAELEQFTYTVSHDLKSPLVTIRGFLGYLQLSAQQGDMVSYEKDALRIIEATDRMHKLLNDLLELSRVGRIANQYETISLREVVEESVRLVEGRLRATRTTVRIDADLPKVYGDRLRLVEVFQNLIDNACKYLGDKTDGVIRVGVETTSGTEAFFVGDNGIGIEEKFHEHIFGLFNKLDPQTDGTGVGLALVRRIVEAHNGEIWVQSEPGKGSKFYFTLGTQGA